MQNKLYKLPAANSVYKPLLAAGCVGKLFWLPCANSTTKRFDHATAHTRGRWQLFRTHCIMKIAVISILAILFLGQNMHGQNRIVSGRVISEDLEPLPMVDIQNSDTMVLGKTDMDGQFKFVIPQGTDRLFFIYVGMERTEIKLKKDCDTIEVAMLYDGTYDIKSFKKIDRLRKKRFEKLPMVHSEAVRNGLFKNSNICYDRVFIPDKPVLVVIRKESKELRKANKNDFKESNNGDIVKIPFGIDTSENENEIRTHYAPCKNCTESDFDYIIEGEIIGKHKRKLTLEIKITKMLQYDFLKYRGKILKIGSNFKYEMKYFEIIIDRKRLPSLSENYTVANSGYKQLLGSGLRMLSLLFILWLPGYVNALATQRLIHAGVSKHFYKNISKY